MAKENGLDFISIGIDPYTFQDALPYAKVAKKLGLKIAINLIKSYTVTPNEFSKIVQIINKWEIADVIYLVDSAGCMLPNEIHEYIDRTLQKVTIPIGFHGHNNLSMAVANSIQAVQSGASFIDTCVRGMGRSTGNAQTEIMVYILSKLGIDLGIDLFKLYDFADNVLLPLMPRPQGLSSEEIHLGVSKFHSSLMPQINKASKQFGVDKKQLIKNIAAINCHNPSQELFNEVARNLLANRKVVKKLPMN